MTLDEALRIVTHGGAGSPEAWQDGTEAACQAARGVVEGGGSLLEAAVQAVAMMEDDARFNAGTGSNLRSDGRLIEMDASVATTQGAFGAVAVLQQVRNPVEVARAVLATDHLLLAGQGALAFAREHGHAAYDPATDGSRRRYQRALAKRQQGEPVDPVEDTVGAAIWQGDRGAGALSSGGTTLALPGRVGDVPLPGCGLRAGPAGVVAATGHGETIARARLADRVHALLEEGWAPQAAVDEALGLFGASVSLGLIVASPKGLGAGATGAMATSRQVG